MADTQNIGKPKETIDVAELEAMAAELEDYIIDGDVYRTVLVKSSSGNRRLTMSGGDLLARIAVVQAAHATLSRTDKERVNGVITQVETTKQALQSRFHELLRRELKSRLGTLAWSDEDRDEDDDRAPSPAEIDDRLRIAAIRKELGGEIPSEVADEMDALEAQLRDALAELPQIQPRTGE